MNLKEMSGCLLLLQANLDDATEHWGVQVERVEM